MQLKLTVEKKAFKSTDGSNIEYVSYTSVVDGESFTFKVSDADKNLLNYLLESMPDFGKKPFDLPLVVTKEKFKSDSGEEIDYFAYTLKLGKKEIKLKPRAEDKRLLTHLLKSLI